MRRAAFALAFLAVPAQAADWQPRELVKHYSISGATAPELYAAIGGSGPLIGKNRAIALTSWDLKWRRDYQSDGSACALISAIPFLTITTTLPKPAVTLRDPAARLWKIFIDGIAAHEKVHGGDVQSMVNDIITGTVGLAVENDPQCKKIREEVLILVKAANEAYKAKSRAFDRVEMAKGGNVHGLILGLVNGR
jgi:predicted secreted Zn-dependent protease